MKTDRWTRFAGVSLTLGILLRAYFIVATPFDRPVEIGKLSAYGDEPAHVAYTMHLLENGELPAFITPITEETGAAPSFENYQSPAYYVLHALSCRAVGADSIEGVVLAGRILSLCFMLLSIPVACKIATRIAPGAAMTACAVIFLSLSPVMVRFSALCGNETLLWLASGVIVLSYLRDEERQAPRSLLLLAVVSALGVYVKLSALLLLPLLFVRSGTRFRTQRKTSIGVVLFFVLLVAPVFLRNKLVFDSFLPLTAGFGLPLFRIPGPDFLAFSFRSVVFPWSEFWKGWIGVLVMAPALLVLVRACWSGAFRPPMRLWSSWLSLSALAAYLLLNFQYHQAEGRYLFVAWPVVVAGLQPISTSANGPFIMIASLTLPYLLFVF
ncbi:MAG: glycosyltransferase family 39 protein [Calditrichaeota bacterium]|nr:glycosyltransferase family 39 protein [Calditrichota bacterium]MCB9366504.1 glycosyltransferase family 39 protein [Calditrichota bacterium]MCB9391238.1 glycosyltransferase family 39 protein [Calditrichota bacterium]